MRRYKLNKDKFINFICGVACLAIIEACFFALLLKL